MFLIRLIFCFTTAVILSCCNPPKEILKYDLNSVIKSQIPSKDIVSKSRLNLCEGISFQWDSVMIVPPYSDEKSFNVIGVKNLAEFKREVSNVFLDEGNRMIAFIKGDSVIRISMVSGQILDFNTLIDEGTRFKVILREQFCNKLYAYRATSGVMITALEK